MTFRQYCGHQREERRQREDNADEPWREGLQASLAALPVDEMDEDRFEDSTGMLSEVDTVWGETQSAHNIPLVVDFEPEVDIATVRTVIGSDGSPAQGQGVHADRFGEDDDDNPEDAEPEDPQRGNPASNQPDTSCLQRIACVGWRDYIEDFIECTQPIDPSLLVDSFTPREREKSILTTLEHVIYSTNLALVAQWNLPHAPIQFNMTQTWNVFRYAYLLGKQIQPSPSPARLPSEHSALQPLPAIPFNAATTSIRTLRSAERHLSINGKEAALVIHAACSNVRCQHVFYQHRSLTDFVVGSTCTLCNVPPDGKKNLGLVPYPRMTLSRALTRFFQIDSVENICETTETRRREDAEFDQKKHPGIKIYREAYSGSDWPLKTIEGNPVDEDNCLVLRLDFGIDWYQPSRGNHARMQSVGPIIAHVTNLPLALRASLPLTLLLGITPGKSCRGCIWPAMHHDWLIILFNARTIRNARRELVQVSAAFMSRAQTGAPQGYHHRDPKTSKGKTDIRRHWGNML